MQIIILPFHKNEGLSVLNDWIPEALLPVVNKPIMEHLIELLVQHQIRTMTLCLSHMPHETEKYFGNGSKWGASFSYSLPGSYGHLAEVLKRFGQPSEPYLCLPINMVTDLDINQFIAAHREGGGDVTLAQTSCHMDGLSTTDPIIFSGMQACPMILMPRALSVLFQYPDFLDVADMIKFLNSRGLIIKTYQTSCSHQLIQSLQDYSKVHKRILKQEFKTITIPGKEIAPGLWIGRNSTIHPQAELRPPLVIGQNSIIRNRVAVAESVVGDSVIIDQDADIKSSIILDETYVGSNLEVKDMVIKKTLMVQIHSGIHVCVGDEVILGDLKKREFAAFIERLGNVGAALILLILFSPILIPLGLYSLLRPSKNFLYAEKRYGPSRYGDLSAEILPAPFFLYAFRSKWRFIHKFPGLINVIRGDLSLVGNSPLTETQLEQLREDWEKLRFTAPAGLFHIWEAEGSTDSTWNEKVVMEGYYAASRSYWGDVKILLKSLFSPII
jgi:NDP-sugar pyrophosphorylase family protein